MSLNSALSSALSGLNASSRAAGTVSSNLANALTEGYGKRTLSISSNAWVSGVSVNGTERRVDPVVLADRRLSDAQTGAASDLATFAAEMETLAGASGDPGSLTTRLVTFETSLVSAASQPSSTQRLQSVAYAAQDVAQSLNTISDGISAAREKADQNIASQVEQLNTALGQVEKLNAQIVREKSQNTNAAGLQDLRQSVIDGISDKIAIRSVPRSDGSVALYTTGGAIVLDGQAAEIGFQATPMIAPHMTLDNGLLGGLTLNGQPIDSTAQNSPLQGGTLLAQFEIRDDLAPQLQAQLDGVARDLAERFGAGGPDTSITATDAGLFTDSGATFDPSDEAGFAGRISLNALVSPDSSEIWRLRDGLGAATTGNAGDATLLNGLISALSDARTSGSVALGTSAQSSYQFAADLQTSTASLRLRQDQNQALAQAQGAAIREIELSNGVDSDEELQNLMQIEKSYAANARVIQTVDAMMDALLSI